MTPIQTFAARHPWPAARPPLGRDLQGWFGDNHRNVLGPLLGPDARLVVELGSWKGLSTRFLCEAAPAATVVAVDTWAGSAEHHADPALAAQLPRLHDQFLANLWDLSHRVVPVRATTEAGIRMVAEAGLAPDLVYVDAAHDFPSVYRDIADVLRWLAPAHLVGDDYSGHWPGVVKAVDRVAEERGMTLEVEGIVWRLRR